MIIMNPAFSGCFSPIFEDKASDYVKKMIREHCSPQLKLYLDYKVSDLPQDLRSHLKEYNQSLFDKCTENGSNLTMFLRLDFLQYFDIRRGKGPEKFIIGLARIGIGELGYFESTRNMSEMQNLKQLVLFAFNNEDVNKSLDSNLNGLTFYELKDLLNEKRREHNKGIREKLSGFVKSKSKYTVVPINSSEDAEKYGNYTSWCITHGSYSSYAKNGSRFYFCLENGFENVSKSVGDGCPLDEYGLSMVSVLIDMDGEPTIVTTRWNHEHDGENNENLHTAEQVQNVLGIPFYETFKPYTKDELKKMGIVSFDDAKERLENGEKPEDIFHNVQSSVRDDMLTVGLNGKWNFINKEGKLISEKWFDCVNYFHDGFAIVELQNRWNFINKEGKLISEKWFDYVYDFHNGFAAVCLNKKFNFIDNKGKLLSDIWFDYIHHFKDGFACVYLNGKSNLINTDGKLYSKEWFDDCTNFVDGICRIENDGVTYMGDTNGKIKRVTT